MNQRRRLATHHDRAAASGQRDPHLLRGAENGPDAPSIKPRTHAPQPLLTEPVTQPSAGVLTYSALPTEARTRQPPVSCPNGLATIGERVLADV